MHSSDLCIFDGVMSDVGKGKSRMNNLGPDTMRHRMCTYEYSYTCDSCATCITAERRMPMSLRSVNKR